MKNLLFLIFLFAFQTVPAQIPDPDFTDKVALQEAAAYQKSAVFAESDDYADYDLVYQQLNFNVDPAVSYISGSVLSEVKFRKDQISVVRFDLNDNMIVDSIWCNLQKVTFQHSGDKISINLPQPTGAGNYSEFEIFYHGAPLKDGFGSFTVSGHNNTPLLWTLSEPYGAKVWWPCKQSLADKIDSIDVYITCPQQYKAASNGKLVSDIVTGDHRTVHWQHRYPIATYLIGIAVTNYETFSGSLSLPNGKSIEILDYVFPEYLATAKSMFPETFDIMDFYNSKFITYPFAKEKYGHAQFNWGGGMEHQTMSFMTSLDFELVAHEMAHQWFGDYITLASWHDIWLNEGFATYLTGLCFENLLGGQHWAPWKKIQVDRILSAPDGSVYVADTTNINRIFNSRLSYSKGAYLLHMLRWELGDQKFFQGLKAYLLDPALANGFASQQQFVKHMETAGDTTLIGFFNDWYYGQGYPVYHLHYYTDYGDNGKTKLTISQSPSNPSVSFFGMHIPVRVWKDGLYKDLRLYNTQQNQEFVISNQAVDSVQFDPDLWLCAKADQISGVQSLSQPDQIQIIPEGSGNQLRIVLPEVSATGNLAIFSAEGKAVLKSILPASDSKVSLKNLKPGMYLIQVNSGSLEKTKKMVVTR
jgi:aminopeptidase N